MSYLTILIDIHIVSDHCIINDANMNISMQVFMWMCFQFSWIGS